MRNENPSRRLGAILKICGKFLSRLLVHLALLLLDATRYLARRLLDSIYIIRLVLLQRAKRRSPERAGDAESRIISLRAKKKTRWERWRALPLWRRLEVQLAVLGILAAVAFAVRAYVSPQQAIVESESEETDGERAKAEEAELAKAKEIEKEMQKTFDKHRKGAQPGQWVFYERPSNSNTDTFGEGPLAPFASSWILPVIVSGEFNKWDRFGVTSPVVIKEDDRYRMWYTGCHFSGEAYMCGVGHAVSKDGIAWEKTPEPLFIVEDPIQSKGLDSVAVVRAGDRYLMWYSILPDWQSSNHYSTAYLATSADGLTWNQEGAVLRSLREGWFSMRLSAMYDGRIFHLWYVDVPSQGGALSLLHLTSSNAKEWQIAGYTSLADLAGYPGNRLWVVSDGHGNYRGFFAHPDRGESPNYSRLFGILTSSDGNTWQRGDDEKFSPSYDRGDFPLDTPTVLSDPDGLWFWFVLRPPDGVEAITAAYRREIKS